MAGRALGRRAALRVLGILVLGGVAFDQVLQHTALSDGVLLGRRVAPFDPPVFYELHERVLRDVRGFVAGDPGAPRPRLFDPELGWSPRPGQEGGLYSYDWAGGRVGERPFPRERASGARRVVALGCSFTRGDEVPGDRTWVSRVNAERPEWEIANLGMGGYGLDQVLLRWRRDGRGLAPDEVWLGVVPATVLRITTAFPPLLRHWSTSVWFKPVFRVDPAGELVLSPSPVQELADFVHLLEDQRAFLDAVAHADLWVRRAPTAYSPRGSSWTHASALARLCLTLDERRGRAPEPWLEDESSEVRRLATALVRELARDARASGAVLRLVVLPSREDLASREHRGRAYWAEWTAELGALGIGMLDLSEPLLEAGVLERADAWMPGGHYGATTNAVVARALLDAWKG